MKRSKRYSALTKLTEKSKVYTVEEAFDKVKTLSTAKFDESIEVFLKLKLKDKQKKETVRGTITFPHTIGKSPVVAVVAEGADQEKAKKAGADFVGGDDLSAKIEKGFTDFDVLLATPETMPKVAKLGKVIGKMGLMPNPKNGTVAKDIEAAVKSFKSGKTNFKMNESGVFQFRIAKSKMTAEEIKENFKAFMTSILNETRKFGENNIAEIKISPSMGPAVKVDVNSAVSSI